MFVLINIYKVSWCFHTISNAYLHGSLVTTKSKLNKSFVPVLFCHTPKEKKPMGKSEIHFL